MSGKQCSLILVYTVRSSLSQYLGILGYILWCKFSSLFYVIGWHLRDAAGRLVPDIDRIAFILHTGMPYSGVDLRYHVLIYHVLL